MLMNLDIWVDLGDLNSASERFASLSWDSIWGFIIIMKSVIKSFIDLLCVLKFIEESLMGLLHKLSSSEGTVNM